MNSKIALGTVQFGVEYGINNKSGQVTKEETFKILEFALANGINTLDTAPAYGNAEVRIGNFIVENKATEFNIVSKYSSPGDEKQETVLSNSLKNLNVKNLYGYLAHDFKKFGNDVSKVKKFLELKKTGLLKKIGFSLYFPKDLKFLIDNSIQFDILQIPYNVFDQRFESYFKILKGRNVEINIRSCFLQGLVFMDPEKLPEKLVGFKNKLNTLQNLALEEKTSVHNLCLNFCRSNPNIDKIILGVDSLQNLKDNLSHLNEKTENNILNQLHELREENENLILPVNW